MTNMRRIVVLGSSHTAAIYSAAEERPDVTVRWVQSKEGARGDISIDEAFELVASLTEEDLLAITWLGTQHNISGLVQDPIPFDFMEPGSDDFDPKKQLIPYNLARNFFLNAISGSGFVTRLAKTSKARNYLLSIPPIIGDQDFMIRGLDVYRGLKVEERGVTPAKIRAKMWRLEMSCMEELAPSYGCAFIPVPPSSIGRDGYLLPDLYQNPTHANTKYGAMVLDQLYTICEDRQPA